MSEYPQRPYERYGAAPSRRRKSKPTIAIVPLCECEGCTYEVHLSGLCETHYQNYLQVLVNVVIDNGAASC